MGELGLHFVALIVLLGLSGFFSGSEAALFSLTRAQLSKLRGASPPARLVADLLAHPRAILITILIGNLIVNVFSTSAATTLSVGLFGAAGVGIAFVFMSILIMVCGEILPKVIAINRAVPFAKMAAYPLKFCHLAFLPVRIPIGRLTDAVVDSLKKRLGASPLHFSQDELLTAIDLGRHDGQLGQFEHELLSNIIEFRDTVVREIMTPSIHVFSLPISMDPHEMIERILETEYSRAPLYGETADDVRGVVHIKELAAAVARDSGASVESILYEPYFVPESTRISELFKQLGRRRSHMAVVIDEYGSYVGIVTMENILEEIVGDIRDAKEPRKRAYTRLDEHRIIVRGSMSLDDFNDAFGTDVSDPFHETIAGYVLGATGRIPREGETIEVGRLRFHVISAQPHRIRKLRVEKT